VVCLIQLRVCQFGDEFRLLLLKRKDLLRQSIKLFGFPWRKLRGFFRDRLLLRFLSFCTEFVDWFRGGSFGRHRTLTEPVRKTTNICAPLTLSFKGNGLCDNVVQKNTIVTDKQNSACVLLEE